MKPHSWQYKARLTDPDGAQISVVLTVPPGAAGVVTQELFAEIAHRAATGAMNKLTELKEGPPF